MSTSVDQSRFDWAFARAAGELLHVERRRGANYIRTPVLYPSGSTVVVCVKETPTGFFVSDDSFGYQEADLLNASSYFMKHAKSLVEHAGVKFRDSEFYVESSYDTLSGAISTVAAASQEAAAISAFRLGERSSADLAENLFEKLLTVFRSDRVNKNVHILGASHTEWNFSTVVYDDKRKHFTIFEPVVSHSTSIAHASMKFQDVSQLESPPKRVSVVRRKAEMGTYLGVLSQVSSVIEIDIANDTLSRLVA